ncbi:MAG: helix-hairpin-helix domain-containing protein [Breznakia sp.]
MKFLRIIVVCLILAFVYFNDATFVNMNVFQSKTIKIEVKGEVMRTGVFQMKRDTRIEDVIEKAGGFSESADISGINLTQKLKNEDVIVIPKKVLTQKVSINVASKEELMSLPGVGPSTADKIMLYRKTKGGFQTLEELMNVKGIKIKSYEKVKDFIKL